MVFKQEILMSELRIMLEKEREMRELYGEILKKLEDPTLHARIQAIYKDEIKHIGYVEIIMSMLEEGPQLEEPKPDKTEVTTRQTFTKD